MDQLTYFIIVVILAFILGYFLLKYLNGDYSYEDKIIKEEQFEKGRIDNYGNKRSTEYVTIYHIKRTYLSGKIKLYIKELKG